MTLLMSLTGQLLAGDINANTATGDSIRHAPTQVVSGNLYITKSTNPYD